MPVKPVVSLLLARQDLSPALVVTTRRYFGPPDLVGPWWPLRYRLLYPGDGPRPGAPPGFLPPSGRSGPTGQLEGLYQYESKPAFSLGGRRLANLDPGYVARERLVLATGKNFSHRIYLDHGIYGDLTLIYSQGTFQTQPWTFPDYARGPLPELLLRVRKKYIWQLKAI